jgi:hypothetical protein
MTKKKGNIHCHCSPFGPRNQQQPFDTYLSDNNQAAPPKVGSVPLSVSVPESCPLHPSRRASHCLSSSTNSKVALASAAFSSVRRRRNLVFTDCTHGRSSGVERLSKRASAARRGRQSANDTDAANTEGRTNPRCWRGPTTYFCGANVWALQYLDCSSRLSCRGRDETLSDLFVGGALARTELDQHGFGLGCLCCPHEIRTLRSKRPPGGPAGRTP